jgi:hypothetical protein
MMIFTDISIYDNIYRYMHNIHTYARVLTVWIFFLLFASVRGCGEGDDRAECLEACGSEPEEDTDGADGNAEENGEGAGANRLQLQILKITLGSKYSRALTF